MLLTVVLTLLVVYHTSAEYEARCNNSTNTTMTFEPSSDGVEGRYTMEFCTNADKTVTAWEIILKYIKNKTPDKCQVYDEDALFEIIPHGAIHSRVRENVKIDLNCTNICFSRYLDLIFSGCYLLESWLRRGLRSSQTYDVLMYIDNKFRSPSYFNNSKTMVRTVSYGDEAYIHWFSGYIPITDYTLQMCRESASAHGPEQSTQPSEEHAYTNAACRSIESSCRHSNGVGQLECSVRAAPGCYHLVLAARAPWRNGQVFPRALPYQTYRFCHPEATSIVAEVSSGGDGWWWAGGALTGVLLAAAGWAVWRTRLAAQLRKQVLRDWLHRYEEFGEGSARGGDVDCVALLYARDCAAAARVVAALKDLLAEAAPQTRVVDVHAAESLGGAAGAPAQWTRNLLASPRSRLLLLATPAARCLYAPPDHDHDHDHDHDRPDPLEPECAALGLRVLYREPAASDALLQYALRLVTETHALRRDQYTRYYVASIAGLPAEMMPEVAPFRRYELPAAARLLVRDVAGLPPLPRDLPPRLAAREDALAAAVADLVAFVEANPDYLKDELLFV